MERIALALLFATFSSAGFTQTAGEALPEPIAVRTYPDGRGS